MYTYKVEETQNRLANRPNINTGLKYKQTIGTF